MKKKKKGQRVGAVFVRFVTARPGPWLLCSKCSQMTTTSQTVGAICMAICNADPANLAKHAPNVSKFALEAGLAFGPCLLMFAV